jgi:uncharacterized damage-inducible protein DinB
MSAPLSTSMLRIILIIVSITPLIAQDVSFTDQFKSDFFKVFNSSSKKVVELAEAIPAEKYSWQPTGEVRSVMASLLHLASANYYLASKLGRTIPDEVDPGEFEESFKLKKEAQKILKESIDHVRSTIENVKGEQLHEKVDFFGGKETKQRVIFQVSEHIAEHLGQLIVYARMNNITPPWSHK